MSRFSISLFIVLLLSACASRSPAPIADRPMPEPRQPQSVGNKSATPAPIVNKPVPVVEARATTYTVKKGDTLYRIALENGLAYRDLAGWNNLSDVNEIKVDQVLRLTAPDDAGGVEVRPLRDGSAASTAAPEVRAYPKAMKLPYATQSAESIAKLAEGTAKASQSTAANASSTNGGPHPTSGASVTASIKTPDKTEGKEHPPVRSDDENVTTWLAPTAGKLLKPYSEDAKGVDLAGKLGQPVVASESGKVVYAGSGLRGYGKMVIIKHNSAFLTAYAHNNKLLVKEGDAVKRGEKIAEMGNSDTDQVKLHFEIRKFGKPVDPTKFITADKS